MVRVPTGYARRSIQQAQAKQKGTAPKAKRRPQLNKSTPTGVGRPTPKAGPAQRRPQSNTSVTSNKKSAVAGIRRSQKRGSSASPGQVVAQVRAKPKGNKPGARVPKPAPKSKRQRSGGPRRGGGTPRPGGRRRY
jgi:hypothetical protein